MSEADQEQPKLHFNAENTQQSKKKHTFKTYKWWTQMVVYSFLVLSGQSVGTILGRLYFNNGGKSQWIATLVQVVGFPVLFPFQWLTSTKKQQQSQETENNNHEVAQTKRRPFYLNLASIYVGLGLFLGADCMLYSIGLKNLPVTTYTLICASQLSFNSLFSYILNGQKFTPYIVNSIFILTVSSVLLVFQPDPGDSNKTTKAKYVLGFICTIAASAGYALMLAVTQLAFQRIIKKETIRSIVDMTVYQSIVATMAIVVGIFASGDWRAYGGEMREYKPGKVSYVMNLFWTSVAWQAFSIGCVGLIFKVSSLFSNVISILGLPVSPVLAVVFLGDKLSGLKAVSMVLAIWGFASYMYQQYLDDAEMKKKQRRGNGEVSEAALAVDTDDRS